MKKAMYGLMLWLVAVAAVHGQGKVLESKKFASKILNREVAYSIYLPEDYGTSERLYPVLYLLHGWSDNETSWLQMGNLKHIADSTIASGRATDMIIVMPDAGETWYVDSYDGKEKYETMFFEELIPYIESAYRARPDRQYRAIAGLSMGGYGSFLYSLHHPDYFTACAPLSAAVYTDEMMEKSKGNVRGKLFDKLYGPGNLTEHWYKNSVLRLLENLPDDRRPDIYYYIDCGDEDTLLHGNNLIHETMQKKGIRHEFRVRDGGHTWTYWRTALPEVMQFVSARFNRS
ncbi:MAG: esterase family protein [Parabacteroides sp.]|nr:esterase family protein [Parabacteroides sp.]